MYSLDMFQTSSKNVDEWLFLPEDYQTPDNFSISLWKNSTQIFQREDYEMALNPFMIEIFEDQNNLCPAIILLRYL